MNSCDRNTEYRCRNGQCIDKEFYIDILPDCMDDSDESTIFSSTACLKYANFLVCDDKSCPSLMFSCGDGHCYDGPSIGHAHSCITQRDRLYLKQMPSSTLILFSHIHLIYQNTQPEWICYNETLCPYFLNKQLQIQKHILNNLTCQAFTAFSNQTFNSLQRMVEHVKRLTLSCSLLPADQTKNNCSLFRCHDKSKCLSYHRVLDGRRDCMNGEDEYQMNTCSYNLPYRVKCDNGTQCIPSWLLVDGTVSYYRF